MTTNTLSLQTIDHIVEGRKAWVRADIRRDDWFLKLTPECLAELRAILGELRAHPLQPCAAEQINAARFAIPACRVFMRQVRAVLDEGVRFAVIDRLPMDEISDDEAKALYWILSSLLARPVQQKLTGTLIYDVHDTGKKATPGSGVRPDQTNMEQFFHNDNAYNTTQPEIVALLCARPAKNGGVSQLMSFYTLQSLFADEALRIEFVMERGQIQYVNNLEACHRRTTFEDYAEPGKKRLMIRLWLRNAGDARYQG